MAHGGAHAIARLTKRDVEALLDSYDTDPIGSLGVALRKVLNAADDATWDSLVTTADFDATTTARLRAGDTEALDTLAAQLNERRTL